MLSSFDEIYDKLTSLCLALMGIFYFFLKTKLLFFFVLMKLFSLVFIVFRAFFTKSKYEARILYSLTNIFVKLILNIGIGLLTLKIEEVSEINNDVLAWVGWIHCALFLLIALFFLFCSASLLSDKVMQRKGRWSELILSVWLFFNFLFAAGACIVLIDYGRFVLGEKTLSFHIMFLTFLLAACLIVLDLVSPKIFEELSYYSELP